MKVRELFEEVAKNDGFAHLTADHPKYVVVVDTNDGERVRVVKDVSWDHLGKALVLRLED